MNIIKDIIYGSQDPVSQVLDLYLPECENADVFIYFHGGGLVNGDKAGKTGISSMAQLTERGKIVISANYRMYPTAKFPEFVEDAAMVVAWAKKNLSNYTTFNKIFIGGSSAGAWLTAMLAYDKKYLGAHSIRTTEIDGYVIDAAQLTSHFNVIKEHGYDSRRIIVDESAPIYFVDETTDFPNIFIFVADNDMPCRYEQTQMFLKTLEMFHCPPEKIRYKLMEGFTHCKYTGNEEFIDLVYDYMETTQADVN